jgi:parallel beta-helix repeat protein
MRSYLYNIHNPVRNIIPGMLVHACIIIIMLLLITTSFICSASGEVDIYVNQTGWWHSGTEFNDSSTPIQAAVNSATAGSMIYVYNGTYKENVDVNKRLKLQGEGADVVNVTADSTSDHIFKVTADCVNISGFSLSGEPDSYYAGIYLDSADHCNIFNNNVSENRNGINLYHSSYMNLTNNTFIKNGLHLFYSHGNTIKNNTINDKPLLYYEDTSDIVIQDQDVGQIVLVECSNITIKDLNISSTNYGIELLHTNNCKILNNTAKSHWNGIHLFFSNNNMLMNNTAELNKEKGIYLRSSNNNMLTNNNAKSNYYGICLEYSSNNNMLTNNTVKSNNNGLYLYYSSNNNILTNNTAKSNDWNGICLSYLSNNNTLMNNIFIKNGLFIEDSYENTVENNTVNDKLLVYYEDTSNIVIQDHDVGQIVLVKCSNFTIEDLNISYASIGIELWQTNDCKILNNNASFNEYGIHLYSSSNNNMLSNNTVKSNDLSGICLSSSSNNNTLTNNNAKSNHWCGIYLHFSSNNTFMNNTVKSNKGKGIYLSYSSNNNAFMNNTIESNNYGIHLESSSNNLIYNNYFNNTNNARDTENNIWNTTKINNTNIIGGPYLGGNYWHDYTGSDTIGDGLGDTLTPYNIRITNGGDYHPLVQHLPSPDTTPPAITNITNSTPTTDSVTIIWDTDENSNSLIRYGTVQSNYTDAVLDTVMVSVHSIMLSGLSANTTYYFAVNSTDASNNSAQSEELNFTTTAATVPSTATVSIENVTLAPGESTTVPVMVNNVDNLDNLGGCRINLTYNASVVHVTGVLQGDMDYLTYNIDNGSGWMTANALNNSGLNGDIVFANIELTAAGIKGEESLLDITVIQLIDTGFDPIDHTVIDGTFIIEEDTEAPVVSDASASPDMILNDNGRPRAPGTNTTKLSVTVIDAECGIANVTIDLSSIGGSADEPMVREGDTDLWTVIVNASAGISFTHQLIVNATDNKGNFNDSVSITLTVLRRGDVYRDNVIDSNDVIYIARYLAGLEPECSNPPSVLVGDVVGLSGDAKGDSTVDLMDALYLARYTAGLEEEP